MSHRPLSYAVKSAESKNALCRGSLQKELIKIDHDQLQRMRELRRESQQFRKHLIHRSGSPSSRPTSALSGQSRWGSNVRAGSASPIRRADGSPSPTRPDQGSPGSPRSPRVARSAVARTKSANAQAGKTPETGGKSATPKQNDHMFIMQHGSNQLQRLQVAPKMEPPAVPQIVISEIGSERPDSARPGPNLARRGSVGEGSTGSPLGSPRGSDSGSESGLLNQSLSPPIRRARSNSMPLVLPLIHAPPARRPSYCPPPEFQAASTSDSLSVMDSPRARSVSFSGIVPARRRGSICERWGSESERAKPRGAERRGSIGMEQMVRDLMYGVQHRELMAYNGGPSVSDKQWEDLKKCRYLRFLPRNNSEDENED